MINKRKEVKCEDIISEEIIFGPPVNYVNGHHFYFMFGNKNDITSSITITLPRTCVELGKYNVKVGIDNNNITINQKAFLKFAETIDNYFINSKSSIFNILDNKFKLKTHNDIYINKPLISKNKTTSNYNINFNYLKNEDGVNNTLIMHNSDIIDVETSQKKNIHINLISNVKITFKIKARVSKNGDHGQRIYQLFLVASMISISDNTSNKIINELDIDTDIDITNYEIGISL
jgi:hypothetical protein